MLRVACLMTGSPEQYIGWTELGSKRYAAQAALNT